MVQKDGLKITRGKNVLNASAHTKLPGKHGSSLQTDSTITFVKNRQLTFVSSFPACFLPGTEEPCGVNDALDGQIFGFCAACRVEGGVPIYGSAKT